MVKIHHATQENAIITPSLCTINDKLFRIGMIIYFHVISTQNAHNMRQQLTVT